MRLLQRFRVTLIAGIAIVSATGCGPRLSTHIEPTAPIPIARQWVTTHTDTKRPPLKFIGVVANKRASRYWTIDFRAGATLATHVKSHEITVPKDSIVRVVVGRSSNSSVISVRYRPPHRQTWEPLFPAP